MHYLLVSVRKPVPEHTLRLSLGAASTTDTSETVCFELEPLPEYHPERRVYSCVELELSVVSSAPSGSVLKEGHQLDEEPGIMDAVKAINATVSAFTGHVYEHSATMGRAALYTLVEYYSKRP